MVDQQHWGQVRPWLHASLHFPYLHCRDGSNQPRGRSRVLRHLAEHPTPEPPTEVEVRDGRLYRWVRD